MASLCSRYPSSSHSPRFWVVMHVSLMGDSKLAVDVNASVSGSSVSPLALRWTHELSTFSVYNSWDRLHTPPTWRSGVEKQISKTQYLTHLTKAINQPVKFQLKGLPCVNSALFMNLHFSALIIIELLPDGRLDKTAIWLNMNSERKRDNILLKITLT